MPPFLYVCTSVWADGKRLLGSYIIRQQRNNRTERRQMMKAGPRIKVTKDGPYEVHNIDRIMRYQIIPDDEGASEEYRADRKYDVEKNPVYVCRCGRTAHRFATVHMRRRAGTAKKVPVLRRWKTERNILKGQTCGWRIIRSSARMHGFATQKGGCGTLLMRETTVRTSRLSARRCFARRAGW